MIEAPDRHRPGCTARVADADLGSAPDLPAPMLGRGLVRHARMRPVAHRFAYPTYFLMLPMRRLERTPSRALPRNRFGLISFHDRDHGDGRASSLGWLDDVLASEGVTDADGEAWLQCYPRVLGYAFKPVNFWYCERRDRSLAAVVVEVNNTFGERHCYLLRGPALGYGRELRAEKVFHVSPFCDVAGDYRFRFMRTGVHPGAAALRSSEHMEATAARQNQSAPAPRCVARIDHHDVGGLLIATSVSGTLEPLTRQSLRSAFFGMPMMTFGVIARIHWQALQLWMKRVPFFRKPTPPPSFVSH